MKNILIVGGTSGLGKALADLLCQKNTVFITGRENPWTLNQRFVELSIGSDVDKMAQDLNQVLHTVITVDILIYCAGFSPLCTIDRLNDQIISTMNNVGLQAPEMLLSRILRRQDNLDGFIAVTSTSQWIPRLEEPVYCAAKAGLAMFAECISLDPRVGKTLVVGPSGMDTKMQWERGQKNNPGLLDPNWVAEQILKLYGEDFKYRIRRVLRDPPRIGMVEGVKDR